MVDRKFLPIVLILILFLSSCASGGKKERNKLRSLIQTSQFDEAIQVIEKSKVYQDKDNRLLFLMEKGLLLHAAGRYYQSSKVIEEARELGRKLYTKSISNKVQKLIANDNYDIYYGERYEISLIHFYGALNHLMLAKRGTYEAHSVKEGKDGLRQIPEVKLTPNQIRTHIMAARAEVLAWDSFLKNLRSVRKGRSVFKNDLLAKVFGAYIHELIGSPTDLQIALQLYKDGHKLLVRNYGAYKSFNGSYRTYNENYEKFPSIGESNVKAQFIQGTGYLKGLSRFLNERIVDLSLQIRPNSIKTIKKRYGVTDQLVKEIKKNRNPNVTILFQKGLIPLKVGKKEYYGLGEAARNNPAAAVGAAVLTVFAAEKLGLTPPPRSYTPAGAYLGLKVAEAGVMNAAISFELPKIQNPGVVTTNQLIIKDGEGQVVTQRQLSLVAPLGDIAEQAVAENAASLYGRIGARLAIKHVTAIAAAFGTYSVMSKDPDRKFLARSAAVFQYIASSKAIEASEKADTRYWSTLPSDVWMSKIKLPPGTYQVYVESHGGGQSKTTYLGPLTVEKQTKNKLVNFRSMY